MGPITLFDKSFLQGLSVDESVWFDNLFLANVCPLFYLETFADLGKPASEARPPEQVVRNLAEKFPEMRGSPSVIHMELALANLYGQPIEMTGRIHMGGGRPVVKDGRTGVIYEQSSGPYLAASSAKTAGGFLGRITLTAAAMVGY